MLRQKWRCLTLFCFVLSSHGLTSFLEDKYTLSPACFAIAAAEAVVQLRLPLLAFLAQLPAALPASGRPLCAGQPRAVQLLPSPVLPASAHMFSPRVERLSTDQPVLPVSKHEWAV